MLSQAYSVSAPCVIRPLAGEFAPTAQFDQPCPSNRGFELNKPPARAREASLFVEFRGFRSARSPQGMFRECSDSAHRLHSKKPPPWRVTGASVARHVERPWVRSKNVYIAEPAPELQAMCCEIGAPRREIGVELDVYPRDRP